MRTPPLEGCLMHYVFSLSMPAWYKPLVAIAPNLQLWCSWAQRWTYYILRPKGQRLRSQQDHCSHLPPECTDILEWNLHNHSPPGPHDTDGTFMVMGLKVKVTDNIFKKISFAADASTVRHRRPSSSCLFLCADSQTIHYSYYGITGKLKTTFSKEHGQQRDEELRCCPQIIAVLFYSFLRICVANSIERSTKVSRHKT